MQSVPGQPQVDADTIALYHFDAPTGTNQVIDATGRYTATLNGNALVTTSGLYAGVLQTDGNGSYVRTGHFDNVDFSQGTIEAFIDFETACNPLPGPFGILSAGGEYGSNQPVLRLRYGDLDQVYDQRYIEFGILANGHWVYANGGISCRYLGHQSAPLWPYETWRFRHVAGTWGPRGVEIWVDGVLHGVGIYPYPEVDNMFQYRCNPQMQLGISPWPPNDRYPLCKTPVLLPTMTSTPPGDYFGGLSTYSTFLIGCDPNGSCFNGRIDEVRISNVQRSFSPSVVPTTTPTPSQTPDQILGEYTVDAATVALYHLNSTSSFWWSRLYNEASQQWDAWLRGNSSITQSGRYNGALVLDGNLSYVEMPTVANSSSGVMEAWIKLSSTQASVPIISRGSGPNANPPSRNLVLGVDYYGQGTLGFGFFGQDSNWYWADSGMPKEALIGCWHHVAGTWGAQGVQIWVDGTLRGAVAYSGWPNGSGADKFVIGCDEGNRCLMGVVDEVRISNIQRSFSSHAPSGRVRFRTGPRAPEGTPVFLPLIVVPQVPPAPVCPFGS